MTTRTLDAEIAFPAQCELAEGPLWDAGRGLLRWVDILPGQVHALDVTSGAHRSFGVGDTVGTVGLTRSGAWSWPWRAASPCPARRARTCGRSATSRPSGR
jgi:sugar lactone lactonase YvrE